MTHHLDPVWHTQELNYSTRFSTMWNSRISISTINWSAACVKMYGSLFFRSLQTSTEGHQQFCTSKQQNLYSLSSVYGNSPMLQHSILFFRGGLIDVEFSVQHKTIPLLQQGKLTHFWGKHQDSLPYWQLRITIPVYCIFQMPHFKCDDGNSQKNVTISIPGTTEVIHQCF